MVAPAYISEEYVDHQLSANLDSTFAFEGPEKLLEIWLWSNEETAKKYGGGEGLRCIPLEMWVKVLDLVNCKILSMKSSKYVDAYLLSESSLFVFPHKLILKTCGTTTTLLCIEKLFEYIQSYVCQKLTPSGIYKVFYSRRSFMFPDRQKHVHKDWKNEIKLLNEYFLNGKSYVVGDSMSDDHWYLYTGGANENTQGSESSNSGFEDQTFEILMTDLDPVKSEQFVTSRKPGFDSLVKKGLEEDDLGHEFGMKTMESTKLDSIFVDNDAVRSEFDISDSVTDECSEVKLNHLPSPKEDYDDISMDTDKQTGLEPFNFIHDAFSFTPCGYSSNSVSSGNGGYYYTLHITPEDGWSYASFETNYPFNAPGNTIGVTEVLVKILSIFKPGKFSVTLINEMDDSSNNVLQELFRCDSKLSKLNYKKNEKILYDLNNNYNLVYLNFERSC